MAQSEKQPVYFPVYDLLERTGGFPCHSCHRGGGSSYGPENTMYSYRKSVWECNTQMLEIDLQLTSDGVLILMHDSFVDRTTNGKGPVRSFSVEEIKKLDAAWNYPSLRGQGITVPTFDEFLEEFLPNENIVFFLDFKDADAAKKTLEVVKERGFDKRIILGAITTSANALLLQDKPAHVPIVSDASTTISITTSNMIGGLDNYTFKHDILGFFLTGVTSLFFTKGLVDAAHKAGKKVVVAGGSLDDIATLQQCIAWGVDIVMTDRPDLLAKLMGRDLQPPATTN